MEPVDVPTCLLVALRVAEKCFWLAAKTRKSSNFLRCIHVFDLVLKYCSDINEGNWLQLLLYFIVLMGIVASVIGMSFFICVSSFRLKFSRIVFLRKRLQLDSKTDLITNGLIFGFFFVGICLVSSTSCLHGLNCAKVAQMLFFFEDIKSFRQFEGFSGLFFKCACNF